jgi:hypothetical protein
MRLLILLLSSMLFVGCAAPIVKVDIANIKDSDAVNVVDLRPASEKENEIFSLAITSEAYGTYRRADSLLNPSAPRILQHRAYEKFNATGKLPKIKPEVRTSPRCNRWVIGGSDWGCNCFSNKK